MYLLSRMMLLLTVVLALYGVALGMMLGVPELFPQHQELFWTLLIGSIIAIAARKKTRKMLTSGGTAAWATPAQMERLDAGTGLILGRVPCDGTPLGQAVKALMNIRLGGKEACRRFYDNLRFRRRKQGRLVRMPKSAVHISAFCPTGGGKGQSLILPFLLTNNESCVVMDGKDGELARLTAPARRRMGHQVILLDPSRVVTKRPDTLNPLDFVDRNSPLAINEADAIGNALVVRTGEEKEPHWLDKSEQKLSALTALTLWWGQRQQGTRSLLRVAEIASNPAALKNALQLMQQHPDIWNGSLARKGGQLSHSVGEELSSTLSTVGRFINFMNNPSVAENLRSSSFDLSKLRKGKMSIYLIQRAADTRTGSGLMRLWLNACIREVMKGGLNQKHKVHAIIDEAAALGKMESIKDILNVGRGFGLLLQLYYQDIGQLNQCWDNPQGVLANTTKVFFSTSDFQTAEFVSKSLGPETILVEGGGHNSNWGTSYSTSTGHGSGSTSTNRGGGRSSDWRQQSRELLKPDEIMQLDPRIAITLTPGIRPIRTRLIRAYEEKALLRRRGLLGRLVAACRTLLISAVLLLMAIVWAAVVTAEFSKHMQQQKTTMPPTYPAAPTLMFR